MNVQRSTEHHESRLVAIDDSVLIHRLLKAHLKNERVELHGATCGADGIKMAKAICPDAILLDIEMADMDGFQVLNALKSDSATQHIPVIFVSGSCTTEDKVRGLDLGAIDFITKPFEITELKARVRSALRITRLIKLLAQRAQVDGLTGLWNRTYFDERLAQEVAESVRYGTNVALAMCDIDHFKNINDAHGHPFGDHVLEEFSRILAENRFTDIICRYGGEEFAMIFPRSDAAGASLAVERVRRIIEDARWVEDRHLRVTVSFGVSDMKLADDQTPISLVASADRALYKAKESGRNRVCVDGMDDPQSLRLSA